MLAWCGYEDNVINHIHLINLMLDKRTTREELENYGEKNQKLNIRRFDVVCTENIDCLAVISADIDQMK